MDQVEFKDIRLSQVNRSNWLVALDSRLMQCFGQKTLVRRRKGRDKDDSIRMFILGLVLASTNGQGLHVLRTETGKIGLTTLAEVGE